MSAFIINMGLYGIWCFLFRNRLDPQRGGSKLFLVIVSLQLLLFMLFSPIVSDANDYANRYARTGEYGSLEPGWVIVSKFMWAAWPQPKSLILVSGITMLGSFAFFTWDNSRNMGFSYLAFICLGFWGMSFFIFRQSIALAIALFGFRFAKRKKLLPFLLDVILATAFHRTAIIFLALYPVSFAKRTCLFHLTAICIGFFLLLGYEPVLDFLFTWARNQSAITPLSGASFLALLIGILVFATAFFPEMKSHITMYSLEIACVLQVLALHFSDFTRAIRYYSIATTIVIANSIHFIKDDEMRFVVEILVAAGLLAFYFLFTNCAYPETLESWVLTVPW